MWESWGNECCGSAWLKCSNGFIRTEYNKITGKKDLFSSVRRSLSRFGIRTRCFLWGVFSLASLVIVCSLHTLKVFNHLAMVMCALLSHLCFAWGEICFSDKKNIKINLYCCLGHFLWIRAFVLTCPDGAYGPDLNTDHVSVEGLGKPAEKHSKLGKPAGQRSKLGTPAEQHSKLGKLVEKHSKLGKSVEKHFKLRKPVEKHSKLGKPVEKHSKDSGKTWKSAMVFTAVSSVRKESLIETFTFFHHSFPSF